MRVLIADSYYPEVLNAFPVDMSLGYEENLSRLMDVRFGSFDAYSRALSAFGWDAIDVIANHVAIQAMWHRKHFVCPPEWADILGTQIQGHYPDVVFLQDLSIKYAGNNYVLRAGQLSCPWPGDETVKSFHILFTSFPHYIQRIEALGVRAVYLPLAFDPIVLDGSQPERDIDISFVGGAGRNSHWRSGTDTLESIAERFGERFQWFGYGIDSLPASSALRACYRGEAWGRKMYEIYRRSKIVVNRHGEVAEGVANNLRMYEATGCGAMLLTDNNTDHFVKSNGYNLNPEIVQYDTAEEAVDLLEHFLCPGCSALLSEIAANGQERTLRDHTYSQRMPIVAQALQEMLCKV